MALGIGAPKTFKISRREKRIPMEVGVQISGHLSLPGTEDTFTEDVSCGGARVWSTRRWKTNDRLILTTPAGSFQATARVAYCQEAREAGFTIGLELLERHGHWIIASSGC
jgi:hypothetical protein